MGAPRFSVQRPQNTYFNWFWDFWTENRGPQKRQIRPRRKQPNQDGSNPPILGPLRRSQGHNSHHILVLCHPSPMLRNHSQLLFEKKICLGRALTPRCLGWIQAFILCSDREQHALFCFPSVLFLPPDTKLSRSWSLDSAAMAQGLQSRLPVTGVLHEDISGRALGIWPFLSTRE